MVNNFKRAVPLVLEVNEEQTKLLSEFIRDSQNGLTFYTRQMFIQIRDNAEWRTKVTKNTKGEEVTLYHRQPENWFDLCVNTRHYIHSKRCAKGKYLARHEDGWNYKAGQIALATIRRHREKWEPLKSQDLPSKRFPYTGPKYKTIPHIKPESSVPIKSQTGVLTYDDKTKTSGTYQLKLFTPQYRKETGAEKLTIRWHVPNDVQQWCEYLPTSKDFGGYLLENNGVFTFRVTVSVQIKPKTTCSVLGVDVNKTPATFIALSDGTFIERNSELLSLEKKIQEIDGRIKNASGKERTKIRVEWVKLHNEHEALIKPIAREIVKKAAQSNSILGMDTVSIKKNTTFGHDKLIMWCQRYAENAQVAHVMVKTPFTSQRCSNCGYIDAENRQTQSQFNCVSCGHQEHADTNAAKNISHVAYAETHGLLPNLEGYVMIGNKPRNLKSNLYKILLISDDEDGCLRDLRGCDAKSFILGNLMI